MLILNLLLVFLLQIPGETVIVGLDDGTKLVVQRPEYTGFIEGHGGEAVLMYRHENFHGEMSLKAISKIEFGLYKRGKPFPMTVTLKNGQTLEVESERRDFVMLKGSTDSGSVTVKHPDPLSSSTQLRKKPNRKNDLTIQYLEFPAP